MRFVPIPSCRLPIRVDDIAGTAIATSRRDVTELAAQEPRRLGTFWTAQSVNLDRTEGRSSPRLGRDGYQELMFALGHHTETKPVRLAENLDGQGPFGAAKHLLGNT